MANALYEKGRNRFLTGDITWTADTIEVSLVQTGASEFYTVDTVNDEWYSGVTGALANLPHDGGTSGSGFGTGIGSTTAPGTGVADGNDVTFSGAFGGTCHILVIYKKGATALVSPLIAVIDTAAGLPVTLNSGDVTVTWDNGTDKIFKL